MALVVFSTSPLLRLSPPLISGGSSPEDPKVAPLPSPEGRRRAMGQGLSSAANHDHVFFRYVQLGELQSVAEAIRTDPTVVRRTTSGDGLSPLHIAAANGRTEVLSMILERGVHADPLNRHKQTPLMLAAIHGEVACAKRLIQSGANILLFDSLHGRTCLHYAAYYGHSDCLRAILLAAQSTPVADSWGFARFVNVRDQLGATPLHLAARQRRPECVQVLLDNGAIISASTGNYICLGSTPLHLAARSGSLDCIRALLARGADRLQLDSSGRIPYTVALKQNHMACARLLDPTSMQPLIWPSPLKFMSELDPETKALLEKALMEINMEREKNIKEGAPDLTSSPSSLNNEIDYMAKDDDARLCCICFDKPCTIEVQNCGHQMCTSCILALCCQCKPDPATLLPPSPVCPFCRGGIVHIAVAEDIQAEPMMSRRLSEGSSSFKCLTSAMGSLGKVGRGSSRISDSCNEMEKSLQTD